MPAAPPPIPPLIDAANMAREWARLARGIKPPLLLSAAALDGAAAKIEARQEQRPSPASRADGYIMAAEIAREEQQAAWLRGHLHEERALDALARTLEKFAGREETREIVT